MSLTYITVQGKAGMGKRKGRDAAADWTGSKVVFRDTCEQAEDARPGVMAAEPVTPPGVFHGGNPLVRHDLNCERSCLGITYALQDRLEQKARPSRKEFSRSQRG